MVLILKAGVLACPVLSVMAKSGKSQHFPNNISLKIPLDILSLLSLVVIAGVKATNGILLIDYAGKYLKEQPDLVKGLLMVGRVRLRPILMTTLATIFGFFPLALAMGEDSEMLQPLTISMIGGMSLSMLLSLLVIPGLYWVVNGKKAKREIV